MARSRGARVEGIRAPGLVLACEGVRPSRKRCEIFRGLAAGFTDDEIQLETTSSGRVAGFVIAERFDGMPQLERQEMLWNDLENYLDPATLASIVSLLTMTPEEVEDDLPAASGG